MLAFVLCQMFCRKGGGCRRRLCSHGSVSFQWLMDIEGGAKCLLRSVRLSCPFVMVLCLSRMCLFRCPSVLKMVVLWHSLHGYNPIFVHCCV